MYNNCIVYDCGEYVYTNKTANKIEGLKHLLLLPNFLLFGFDSHRSLIFRYQLLLHSRQAWRVPAIFHSEFPFALGIRSEMENSISNEINSRLTAIRVD